MKLFPLLLCLAVAAQVPEGEAPKTKPDAKQFTEAQKLSLLGAQNALLAAQNKDYADREANGLKVAEAAAARNEAVQKALKDIGCPQGRINPDLTVTCTPPAAQTK